MRILDRKAALFINGEGTQPSIAWANQMLRCEIDHDISPCAGKQIPEGSEGCLFIRRYRYSIMPDIPPNQRLGAG